MMTTSNEHNNAPAVPQGEQATIAGLDAANGHLSTLLDDSVLMLKQLRQMVDDLHDRWSNGGKPERGEFELLDRVDDWLSCRPDSMLSPPAPNVLQEPVMWQYRTWFAENTGTPGWSEWAEVKARNAYTGTVMDSVREFQHYIAQGYKYEIRALYAATTAPAPAQEPVFCEFCGGNDDDPPQHCMDCARPDRTFTLDQIAAACAEAGVPDSKFEAISIAALRAKGEASDGRLEN